MVRFQLSELGFAFLGIIEADQLWCCFAPEVALVVQDCCRRKRARLLCLLGPWLCLCKPLEHARPDSSEVVGESSDEGRLAVHFAKNSQRVEKLYVFLDVDRNCLIDVAAVRALRLRLNFLTALA